MARLISTLFLGLLLLINKGYSASDAVDEAFRQADVCARCHAIHVVEWGYSRHRSAGTDCKSCHGDSQGHVRDERNNVKPDRLPRRSAIGKLCLECHEEGCPSSKQKISCQDCHHIHALLNPHRAPETRDEHLEQLEKRWHRYAQLMEEGEKQVKGHQWETAQSHFRDALLQKPEDRRALERLKMCERRMKPGLPGFEIMGNQFDETTGLPLQVRVKGLNLPMLLVPGGEFDMGSSQFPHTQPVHTVRIDPFYLARHELIQDEWHAIMGEIPLPGVGSRSDPSGRLPVGNFSWQDAQALIETLNQSIPGGEFRLPTEAEWEFTAQTGGESEEAFERSGPRIIEQGHPNQLGFFDMAGNLREWCSSLMHPYPYRAGDGRESSDGLGLRVLRGGSYVEPASWYQPALRHGERPDRCISWNGLRLARSIPSTAPQAKQANSLPQTDKN